MYALNKFNIVLSPELFQSKWFMRVFTLIVLYLVSLWIMLFTEESEPLVINKGIILVSMSNDSIMSESTV